VRKSKTLARLRAGEPVRMCALGHYIPAYIRHAAHHGYDCIWLDLEHRLIAEREVQAMLAHFHLADIDCMVRVPTLDKTQLYRYLEEGATGLMVPLVSTAEKAAMLVDSVKFPPIGERGLDGAGLDGDFYLGDSSGYVESANRETFLVVQIETPEAVANVDEIAAVEGVDGMFVGPGDLGLRLQHSAAPMSLEEAIDRVAQAAARHGKAWGCPAGSADHVQRLYEQGARLIVFGGEFLAMMKMFESCAADLKRVYQA